MVPPLRFGGDIWVGDVALKDKFRRLVRLETNLDASIKERLIWDGSMVSARWCWSRSPFGRTRGEVSELEDLLSSVKLEPDIGDTWSWESNNGGTFTTKILTKMINAKTMGAGSNVKETLKNNLVPKKVEVFIWRARKKRIPVRVELDKRGIDLHSVRCPLCDDDIESVDHSLFSCNKVVEVWNKIFNWWGVNGLSNARLDDLLQGKSCIQVSDSGNLIWQAVIWTNCYLIWKNRNQIVFKNKSWSYPIALNEIQIKGYEWIAKRSKKKAIDWHNCLETVYMYTSFSSRGLEMGISSDSEATGYTEMAFEDVDRKFEETAIENCLQLEYKSSEEKLCSTQWY
ncbi:uncharacterized protein [Rutidosis leptorrhynchoides]|uniref:uncharacterized protein n=1 Tax=Rutidosis leptorrhynchoides TaxID=125765 RepID=UPI003A992303